MNRQKKILKANECGACDAQMATIHIQNGIKLCDKCYDIIRMDTPEETQALKNRKPSMFMFNEEKIREVWERIFERYMKTGQRLLFDRDILDSQTSEYLLKEFITKVWSDIDTKLLFGPNADVAKE
jgi:hypothetical protein